MLETQSRRRDRSPLPYSVMDSKLCALQTVLNSRLTADTDVAREITKALDVKYVYYYDVLSRRWGNIPDEKKRSLLRLANHTLRGINKYTIVGVKTGIWILDAMKSFDAHIHDCIEDYQECDNHEVLDQVHGIVRSAGGTLRQKRSQP